MRTTILAKPRLSMVDETGRETISRVVRDTHPNWSDETCDGYGSTLVRLPRKAKEEIVGTLLDRPSGPRFTFLSDTDLEAMEPPEWLIQDLIQEKSLAALFGPPGSGKSFLVLDLAMCISTGIRWAGGRQTKPGHVVYVLAEGATTLGPRITAWKDYMGAAGSVGVSFVTVPVPLMDPVAVTDFISEQIAAEPERPSLVIIDTLARCMAGGDENSARDMGALIAGADKIRSTLKCAVLLVHHTNKGGDSERGSTALRGAVDTLLKLKKSDSGTLTLECEKHKDAPDFRPIELRLQPHRDSVVLTDISGVSVDDGQLTSGEIETLRILSVIAPPEGMATSNWEKATEKTERTFFRHVKRLRDGGFLDASTVGRAHGTRLRAKGGSRSGRLTHVSDI